MNARAFNFGLFATPKRRHEARHVEYAHQWLGTEVTFYNVDDKVAAVSTVQNLHKGERVIIASYEFAGTRINPLIRVGFAIPAIMHRPIEEAFVAENYESDRAVANHVYGDKRMPPKRKYVIVPDLRHLRVYDPKRHVIASDDAFESHMIDRDLVRRVGAKRSFRPDAATLWKAAGQEMTVALHQPRSALMPMLREIPPILFTEPHIARMSAARVDVPVLSDRFQMKVVQLNAPAR